MRDARTLSGDAPAAPAPAPAVGPLSVAYDCPVWPPEAVANGVVMYVAAIGEALRAQGHRACVLARSVAGGGGGPDVYDLGSEGRPGPARRLLDRLAYRVSPERSLEARGSRSLVKAARRAVAERGVQLLEMEEAFGWPLAVRDRVPVALVVRLHGPWFLNAPANGATQDEAFRRRVRREGRAIAAADAVTAPSAEVLERTRSYYGLELPGAEVIPPPIPPLPPQARWRPEACEPGLLLFVGRFDRHKGGDVALDAFGLVAARHPGARLLFAGPDRGFLDDGGRTWSFDEYVRAKLPEGAARRVEFLGQTSAADLPALRRRAAATLVASRYETFCLTAAEPMAQGCPVVAAGAGAIPELIEDGVNGLLCRPGDAADLAEKLGLLLEDPGLAARLGARAGRDYEGRLGPPALASRMAGIYRRAIDRRRGGGRP